MQTPLSHLSRMAGVRAQRRQPARNLTDDAEVAYQISALYAPEAAAGYRYDNAAFGVVLEVSRYFRNRV